MSGAHINNNMVNSERVLELMHIGTEVAQKVSAKLRECCRQAQEEVVSNSRKNLTVYNSVPGG